MGNGEMYPPDIDMLRARAVMGLGALYIRGGDAVQFTVFSSVASQVVSFRGYLLNTDNRICPFNVAVAPTSDRVATSVQETIGEGILLHLTAFLTTGSANRGQTYCRVRILQGNPTTPMPNATILQGYVTDNTSPTFPGGNNEGSLDGQGYVAQQRPANPGAGNDISVVVPTGARWKFHGMGFDVTSSADVADRFIALYVDDAGRSIFTSAYGPAQAASLTKSYYFANCGYFTTAFVSNNLSIGFPNLILAAGMHISSSAFNLQLADTITSVTLLIEEWIET